MLLLYIFIIIAGNACMEFRSCSKRFQTNYVPLYFFSGLEKRGLSTFFFRWIFVMAKLSHTEMRQHMTTPLCPILKTPEKTDTSMFIPFHSNMGGKEGNLAFDSFPNSNIFSCSCQQKLLGSLRLSPWVGVSFRGVQSGNGPRDWAFLGTIEFTVTMAGVILHHPRAMPV